MFKMFSTLTLFGLAMVSAVCAQSFQPAQAKIPFAFAVQHTTLAAGNYQLTYTNTGILSIRGLDRNSGALFANTIPADAPRPWNGPGKLVFDCYGRTCYLAQVWPGGSGGNRGLALRRTEPKRVLALTTRVIASTIPAK